MPAGDHTPLAIYLYEHELDPTWKGLIQAFRDTVKALKFKSAFRSLKRRNVFAGMRMAYMGVVWKSLSIDLVAASLRQREFARKITGPGCHGIDAPFPLANAATRYHKFLLLMNRDLHDPEEFDAALKEEGGGTRLKKKPHLVPTLDIDLCWHTHQLFPVGFRQWCVSHLGRAINHDDTIGKGSLEAGLRATSLAWHHAYQEGYTTDDLRKGYFSTGRKIAGVLFPPYGLHMLNKANKLDEARTGISFLRIHTDYAGVGHAENTSEEDSGGHHDPQFKTFSEMYPYWTMHPHGWKHSTACSSGPAGSGGWGPGVGGTKGGVNAETAACAMGNCAGACGWDSSCGVRSGGGCKAGNCETGTGRGGGGGGGGCGGGCGG